MNVFNFSTDADQQFAMILNNRRVTFRFRYNVSSDRWSFDLSIDDQPVLYGRRVVTGVDLIGAHNFDIGLLFAVSIVPGAVPDRVQLPNGSVRMFHIMQDELNAAISS